MRSGTRRGEEVPGVLGRKIYGTRAPAIPRLDHPSDLVRDDHCFYLTRTPDLPEK
jgi:hypothetical protein